MKVKRVPLIALFLVITCFVVWAGGQSEEAEAPDDDKPSYEGQSIYVVSFLLAGLDEVRDKVGEFEEMYGIEVKWDMLAMGTMREKMMIDFNAGTKGIDVGMSSIHITPTHLGRNNLEQLDAYLNGPLADDELLVFDDFFPSAIDLVTFPKNGLSGEAGIFGMPYIAETQGLMYRKSIYDKYNLSVPKTLEEYVENARIITEGESPEMYGIAWRALRSPQIMWSFTQVLRGFGGTYFRDYPDDLTPTINDPTFIEAVEFFADSFDYAPPGGRSFAYTEVISALQSGQVAQCLDDIMYARYIEDPEESVAPDDWAYGVLPLKAGLDYDDIVIGPGIAACEHWVINADISQAKKDAAFLFIQWASSQEILAGLAEKGYMKGFLTRNSQYEVVKDEPWAQAYVENIAHASKFARPKLPEWVSVSEQIQIALSSVVTKDAEAKEALDRAQKAADRILREAGRIE